MNNLRSDRDYNGSSINRNGAFSRVQKYYGSGIQSSQLMKLFEEELKDIYWAEKALTRAMPKMIKNATSDELIEALESHLAETEEQVIRVERVFEILGKKATARKCEAMEGLIKEVENMMETCEEGAMCDVGIISAAQKVEHYEIASYGSLCQYAEMLGLDDAYDLLHISLDEEWTADEKLADVSIFAIQAEAEEEEAYYNPMVITRLERSF